MEKDQQKNVTERAGLNSDPKQPADPAAQKPERAAGELADDSLDDVSGGMFEMNKHLTR